MDISGDVLSDKTKILEQRGLEEIVDDNHNLGHEGSVDIGLSKPIPFRERRRPKKARPRRPAHEDTDDENVDIDDEDRELEDLSLLRQAQRMREQVRRFQPSVSKTEVADRDKSSRMHPTDSHVVGGLRTNFAVESSGYDAQKNMEEYVEMRLAENLAARQSDSRTGSDVKDDLEGEMIGQTDVQNSIATNVDDEEATLYVIPERLRVQSRELYDPTEGLPTAGVEEVDIGNEARHRTAVATAVARRKLLERTKALHVERNASSGVVGNVSANFEKHRRDWIETNLGPRKFDKDISKSRNSTSDPAETHERPRPSLGRGPHGNSSSHGGLGKRQQFATATDHVVADRFRKRWRK